VEGDWDVDLAINPRTRARPGTRVAFDPILVLAFIAVLAIVIVILKQTIDGLQSLPGQDRVITPFPSGILLPQILVLRIKPGGAFSPPTCC
jgi:hypothetical protein